MRHRELTPDENNWTKVCHVIPFLLVFLEISCFATVCHGVSRLVLDTFVFIHGVSRLVLDVVVVIPEVSRLVLDRVVIIHEVSRLVLDTVVIIQYDYCVYGNYTSLFLLWNTRRRVFWYWGQISTLYVVGLTLTSCKIFTDW